MARLNSALLALVCTINITTILGQMEFLTGGPTEYYDVPITKVDSDPFLTYYTYPIKGNGLIVNDTHVFMPIGTNLYSEFYMDFPFAEEKFYGMSQQTFAVQRKTVALAELETNLLANDHMAFIKHQGTWRDSYDDGYFEGIGYEALDFETSDTFTSLDFAKMYLRLVALIAWLQTSGLFDLLNKVTFNPAQVPHMKKMKYSEEDEQLAEKLRLDMNAFISDIREEDYHHFEKSSFFCLHANLDGIEATENDGKPGWWIPLKTNFISWRGIMFQTPFSKFGTVAGIQSWNKVGDNLEVMFRGTQLYYFDFNGIDPENFVLLMGPPNNDIPDVRPPCPAKPTSIQMRLLRATINNMLPSNNRLPWYPREQLCPDFENSFEAFKSNCRTATLDDQTGMLENMQCANALVHFYPCMSYYVRSSEKYAHGIDGLQEFGVVYHVMLEAPWDIFKMWANEKPWDEEFDIAMTTLFGHPKIE